MIVPFSHVGKHLTCLDTCIKQFKHARYAIPKSPQVGVISE
jgi:hypothetical protein